MNPVVRILARVFQRGQQRAVHLVYRLDHAVVAGDGPAQFPRRAILPHPHLPLAQKWMIENRLVKQRFHAIQKVGELIFAGEVRVVRLIQAHLEQ